jgi:hypothetical protein
MVTPSPLVPGGSDDAVEGSPGLSAGPLWALDWGGGLGWRYNFCG